MDKYVNTEDGLIDTETGEIIKLDAAGKPIKTGAVRAASWFGGIKKGFRMLAKTGLSGNECAVLFDLLGRVRYGNTIIINQGKMAVDLGLSRSSVGRAVQELEKHSIITRMERASTSGTYKIERAICWCGKLPDAHK